MDLLTNLQPHQQRVVAEKQDNDNRLAKLNDFIANNPLFLSSVFNDAERLRLVRQSELMMQLSQVLAERIEAFTANTASYAHVAQNEALDQLTAEAQADGEYD